MTVSFFRSFSRTHICMPARKLSVKQQHCLAAHVKDIACLLSFFLEHKRLFYFARSFAARAQANRFNNTRKKEAETHCIDSWLLCRARTYVRTYSSFSYLVRFAAGKSFSNIFFLLPFFSSCLRGHTAAAAASYLSKQADRARISLISVSFSFCCCRPCLFSEWNFFPSSTYVTLFYFLTVSLDDFGNKN